MSDTVIIIHEPTEVIVIDDGESVSATTVVNEVVEVILEVEQGVPGPAGAAGAAGAQGNTGPQGPAGEDGEDGLFDGLVIDGGNFAFLIVFIGLSVLSDVLRNS